jgi:hypothetical protein
MGNNDLPATPGYQALRLAADLANGGRGNTLWFGFDQGLELAPPPPVESGTHLPVRSPVSNAGRPAVLQAEVWVDGFDAPCVLDADDCCALFWSESSVEKFLLPYYASAAGAGARQMLEALCWAWYNFDASTPVVALAFRYGPTPAQGPQSLPDTVGVVHGAGDGTLAFTPLPQFLTLLPQIDSANPPPAAQAVAPPVPTSDAEGLGDCFDVREIAEYVQGLAGQTVRIYHVDDGAEASFSPIEVPWATLLFETQAPLFRTDRPAVVDVRLEVAELGWKSLTGLGGAPENVPDSAFWRDASVDLLLLPYYASVKGATCPPFLALLLGAWAGRIDPSLPNLVDLVDNWFAEFGILLPPNLLVNAAEGAGRNDTAARPLDDSTTLAYSIVHLPRSEYVDENGNPVPALQVEHRTYLMTAGGEYPLLPPTVRLRRGAPVTA